MTTTTDSRVRHRAAGAARGSWLMLIVLLAGQFMALLHVTIVNVAMPTIGRSLHASGRSTCRSGSRCWPWCRWCCPGIRLVLGFVATFGSLFLTLGAGRGSVGVVSAHALAVTFGWLAVLMVFGVAAGIPLARTVAAARP
jgi:hypothetical protein